MYQQQNQIQIELSDIHIQRLDIFAIPCVVVSPLVPGMGTTPLSTCEESAKYFRNQIF